MLPNFQTVSERTTITGDHHPSENAGLDCVPASLVAGAMYLNGVSQMNDQYNPDAFKDNVYGQGYQGGMAASAFVDYLATLNIKLWSFQADNNTLVREAHYHLSMGYPVVFTEANPYGNPAYSHVCVLSGEVSGGMIAMDPWIARFITRSDSQWSNTFINGELWIMEYLVKVPTGWSDDGAMLYAPDKLYPVVHGFRARVLSSRWDPDNWPLEAEVGAAPIESSNPDLGSGTRQTFRKSILEWTPELGVLEGWIGQELLQVRSDLATCQVALAAQIAPPPLP